ncbi:MAG: glycoside hydrolase family 127 protein [Sedimentisphaerales bacterium]|nr:glycoside hydrolase family 127 protein [Sedimentisphaerales bacterium]
MRKYILTLLLFFMFCGHVFAQGRGAAVNAFENKMLQARPLDLTKVRLTGGPLKQAQDAMARVLLGLEPDRMLAGYRIRAGLEPKAEGYGGWDAVDSRQLTGHVAGHYLSAVSIMYAATGNEEFKRRADYIVGEFKEVQDKNGDGYLGALMGNRLGAQRGGRRAGGQTSNLSNEERYADGRELFKLLSQGEIRSGGFDLNGMWSPWYTLHKTYAGLRDAYRYTGNKTALDVEIKFAEWAEGILAPLDDDQIQRMLNTEFGGMNEIMVDLYADTGDKRWLDLSYKFEHERFIEPLQRHQDRLAGQHGNTAIPKLIGSADRFACTGNPGDLIAASFFWDQVVQHHSFATGGHGRVENFPAADELADVVTGSGRTAETCNVYNMLKLTRRLFQFRPDAHYADFHERALFNHILAALDPADGSACYMVPVGLGVRQEYERNMLDGGFTCCVGTGLESHGLHADGIYYEMDDKLWVNLYAPSTAEWAAAGVKLDMTTDFPEGESATLKLTVQSPREFTLALRRPYWAGNGFAVKVNGEVVVGPSSDDDRESEATSRRGFGQGRERSRGRQTAPPVSSYVELKRTWRTGDTVELTMPKSLRLEPTPDDPNRTAILWGPLVLAGDVTELAPARPRGERGGRRGRTTGPSPYPVFVAAGRPVAEWLKPVPGEPGRFRTDGIGRTLANPETLTDVAFAPFYRTHRRTYGIYWELVTSAQWQERLKTITPEERQRRLEAATVGHAQPGEMQAERDFNYQSSIERAVERIGTRGGRGGTGWFSFDLPVESTGPMTLIVTYHSDEQQGAEFDVLVDGIRIGSQPAESSTSGFFDVEYSISPRTVRGKEKVTVRFEAADGNQIATVFGIRMIRADAER